MLGLYPESYGPLDVLPIVINIGPIGTAIGDSIALGDTGSIIYAVGTAKVCQ